MAIHFMTSDPKRLLAEFDARIAQKEAKGQITTWLKASDGRYTHLAEAWQNKAWLKPKIQSDGLTFNIIKPPESNIKNMVYAYYHGHLIETFLNHFDSQFVDAIASALAEADDIVG
ncbi:MULTISPECIES: hypothetical protein [unclassified Polaromonas]|uniref:hypothetical protein n=1 Tax=unclassified Polaromonas TaxID=2638319 RepID=UPI000F09799D|nr:MULTISPECIES: hypothetical protein [unclassified Polaromonas]AYQ27634.1 hypothetical protein DT070_06060 [Polaromonas sp. SP1]QGJ17522.1 hypothetical protein F7R28_03375 [Polaromonas sp. Pch-P]